MIAPIDNLPVWTASIFVQSSVVILLGILCSRFFRWNAAVRHTILLATLLAVILLPTVSIFYVANDLSLWPTIQTWFSRSVTEDALPTVEPGQVDFTAHILEADAFPLQSDSSSRPHLSTLELTAVVWGVVTLLLAARFFVAFAGLRRIRRRASCCVDVNLQSIARGICDQMRVRQKIKLLVSSHVRAPVAIGVFRPAVLLPASLVSQLSDQELRNILIHEFAHIGRRDHVILMLQKVIAIFFWPQPFLHALNRMLSRSREEICDNHVLKLSERVSYGETLLKLTEHVNPAFSLGLLGNAWKLEDRISQLLSERRNPVTNSNFFVRSAAFLIFGMATLVVSLATPLDAEDKSEAAVIADLTFDNGSQVIELKTADGKSIVSKSKKNLVFYGVGNDEFDDSDLSATDKAAAEKLKSKYKSLKEQQSQISAKMKKLESKLKKLGVKLGKSKAFVTVVESKPVRVGKDGIAFSISKTEALPTLNLHAIPPSAPDAPKPITIKDITVELDAKPAVPEVTANLSAPAVVSDSKNDLEKRLQRLERLIEKVIETNESTRNAESESDL